MGGSGQVNRSTRVLRALAERLRAGRRNIKRRPRLWAALGLMTLPVLLAYAWCLPNPLFDRPESRLLLSADGRLMGAAIAADQQWRFPLRRGLPDKYVTALLMFEDKRFYSHFGVDVLAFGRAVIQNLSKGRVVSGGSTISMQLIRLARHNPERTYSEKLLEMIMATRLELRYSKQQILEYYAANAPFGGNVVGVEAAAWRYFGRDPQRLSWAESTLLAVLPNSPALMHPGKNREKLQQKRDRLLQRLHTAGHLDELQLQLALAEPLPEKPKALPMLAPHLLNTLSARYQQQARFQSTLDYSLQKRVNEIVMRQQKQLQQQGIANAAVLVLDNENFEVLAYAGNSRWSTRSQDGYAVDIIQRPRSTGSVLKPLLFASMVQNGEILPATLVPDVPSHFDGYRPENFDRSYRGAVPARLALARSLNIPAVRMLQSHGIPRFYDLLRNLGMTTLFRAPDDYGLTLILGGAEGSLWELTQMYANLAKLAKQPVRELDSRYWQASWLQGQQSQSTRRVDIHPAAAWLTLQALQEVNRPGNDHFWRQFASSQRIAWKTGTSYGLRDGWAIGSNQRFTVGVWTGNASGEGRAGLTGLGAAAPILFDVFNTLPATPWFTKPEALLKEVSVCVDDGLLSNGHCPTKQQWLPVETEFRLVSPNYRRVHLDSSGRWQVHSRCESVSKMQHRDWFVLPPVQAFYYAKHHARYRQIPAMREDCGQQLADNEPMELVYPQLNTRVYIPVDLGGRRSETIFEVVHRQREATIYWHLDEQYLGETRFFHQLALDVAPGPHQLTLVDSSGHRLTRRFEVLGK